LRRVSLVVALLVLSLVSPTVPVRAAAPLPRRIASIGDSISRAANACCSYGDHPSHSWSTGGGSSDGVRSHYERILASQPLISGRNHNDAVSGAKMADAPAQAARAVSQQAEYVTILMGANDVCTSSPTSMTSTSAFRTQFESTMQTLASELPANAHVFVSSIPNIYRLWQVLRDNIFARTIWNTFDICQSMLGSNRTETERQAVLKREQAFDQILANVCAQYTKCKFDGYAVYNFQFTSDMISSLDYFHPNRNGQGALARVTWGASWWTSS
jgi:lysophospholipase L1-like esterase